MGRPFIGQDEDIKVSNIATKGYQYINNREVFSGYDVRARISNIRYNHSWADSMQRVVNLMALADVEKNGAENVRAFEPASQGHIPVQLYAG